MMYDPEDEIEEERRTQNHIRLWDRDNAEDEEVDEWQSRQE